MDIEEYQLVWEEAIDALPTIMHREEHRPLVSSFSEKLQTDIWAQAQQDREEYFQWPRSHEAEPPRNASTGTAASFWSRAQSRIREVTPIPSSRKPTRAHGASDAGQAEAIATDLAIDAEQMEMGATSIRCSIGAGRPQEQGAGTKVYESPIPAS
ncbi:hypothetical protein BDV98DRAFT_593156 [Pterulicium gracile]|uniref:Uncharacterized protein n=1 Tax=Pterulicium gracile TaxID=1884261 RepID=A0A5C3QJC0_9AGAR|nr:hypothetical protein BDV98DRAFT_593156 [Pterula gracilis]